MVNVATVPRASAMGSSSPSSGRGGRCTLPSADREPSKPNFQGTDRPAADDEVRGRLGPAGRLDGQDAAPRQVAAVGDRPPAADL